MWPWVQRGIHALIFDEAVAQRLVAAGLFGVGSVLVSGGVIPGSELLLGHVVVIPLGPFAKITTFGGLLEMAGIYLGAGGKLPTSKNGNGAPAEPAPVVPLVPRQ